MREKTLTREKIFSGKILDLDVLEVELEDGSRAKREIVRHKGAVGVLAFKPDGEMVLVRQFRKATEGYCLEIAAGLLEEGESGEECARREVREETGYSIEHLEKLGEVNLSPGFSNERIKLYYAEVGADPAPQSLDAGEHVDLIEIPCEQFRSMLANAEIDDGKTLAAWALYENRNKFYHV